MKRKKSTGSNANPIPMEHACDLSTGHCHCDELAPVIEELSRQIHLLGVIIDELVSEFQWQNNHMAESIRQAGNVAAKPQPTVTAMAESTQSRRSTLFD